MESHVPYPARFVSRGNVSVEMKQAVKAKRQGLIVMQRAVAANVHQPLKPVQMVYHVLTEDVAKVYNLHILI